MPPCACPTDGIIDLLGKKWTLCLVATVANRPGIRFNQLLGELRGVSPKTLADTLRLLQQHGVLRREAFAEVPPRVQYTLTPEGQRLSEAVRPLMAWAQGHGSLVCCP